MDNKIDQKYIVNGEVTKRDGTPVPTDEIIIFRAKDPLVPNMLQHYAIAVREQAGEAVEEKKAARVTCDAVFSMRKRVMAFQAENPELVKHPDTTPEDLGE